MLRIILKSILDVLYRVEIKGLENFDKAGKRVLIIANHLSFLDAVLISVYFPERLMFAVNSFIAQKWWLRPFLSLVEAFPLDPTNPYATKTLIKEIQQDKKCVIFPEGRITVTGSLMKIYEGPGMIAEKSEAMILPVRLDGAQYTPFSRLKGKVRLRLFPKITINIQEPIKFEIDKKITGKARRAAYGRELYDLMTEMIFQSSNNEKTLFESLVDAKHVHGGNHDIVVDIERNPLNYRSLILKSIILGNHLAKKTKEKERLGILLPNMSGSIVTFFALQFIGRTPAMLNFSVGTSNIKSACRTAKLKSVITSKRFIEKGKLEDLIKEIKKQKVKVIYLEDIKDKIKLTDKLQGFVQYLAPIYFHNKIAKHNHKDDGVILFTSGSEGTPKGVVLSHQNIQSNRLQLGSRIDFGPTDIVFNALPIFHSFGLTGGTILPILSGIKTFFYPSPLHYRIVPELIYDSNATIVFGTDTFLSGYARFAHPYDFYAVRYIFAGAEKLKDETRKTYSDKYGVRVLEGYGATETAPGISINTPMHNKAGTVGRILPGIEYKIEDIKGVDDGGRFWVKGPNVMKGYFLADKPAKLQPPEDNWYDTGDIVEVDEEGYIIIKGRAKRFAKIGGEMISLTAVEAFVKKVWGDEDSAVVNIPDKKKGEQLVLFTTKSKAERKELSEFAKANGISELSVPKKIVSLDKIPVLGTGKTDYVNLNEMAIKE